MPQPNSTVSRLQNNDNIAHGRGELTPPPEPCGHHCDPVDCPGCGDDYAKQREARRATLACEEYPDFFESFYSG